MRMSEAPVSDGAEITVYLSLEQRLGLPHAIQVTSCVGSGHHHDLQRSHINHSGRVIGP
jgi:hypothetical protein